MSWPVVGKGGKVNKRVRGGFGKSATGAKFIKFDCTSKQSLRVSNSLELWTKGGQPWGYASR